MNVILGGTLHQNIPNHWQNCPSDSHYHKMVTNENSILNPIYGSRALINSFHHQSINLLGKGFDIIATDPRDNMIEAVISNNPNLKFIGVQWHPELLQHKSDTDVQLFN